MRHRHHPSPAAATTTTFDEERERKDLCLFLAPPPLLSLHFSNPSFITSFTLPFVRVGVICVIGRFCLASLLLSPFLCSFFSLSFWQETHYHLLSSFNSLTLASPHYCLPFFFFLLSSMLLELILTSPCETFAAGTGTCPTAAASVFCWDVNPRDLSPPPRLFRIRNC